MNVSEFMSILEINPQKTLRFSLKDKFKVLPFIHITEIKNIVIDSVDCGGLQNKWNETVMQLWTGVTEDDGHRVDSSKALSIIKRVNQKAPLDKASKLLIEYGDVDHVVAQYDISLEDVLDDTIYFELHGVLSQCKEVSGEFEQCCSPKSECCA